MSSNGHIKTVSAPTTSGRMILFRRREIKYLIDRTTRTALTQDLHAFMRPDSHAGREGAYLVRSLYFDTSDYLAYHEKLAGAAVRHKLRIRAYGENPRDATFVRLEVKSRLLSFIHKITVDIPVERYDDLEPAILGRTLPPDDIIRNSGISKEFFRLQRQYNMAPKIMVQYRREAFERIEINRVRVNFDDQLVASRHLNLLDPITASRNLLKYGKSVFEIKVDGEMPYWLHKMISKYDLQDQAFSKFTHAIRSEARFSSFHRASDII